MPRFPLHHSLPELSQTHVHWVGDAIQPSHSLSSPFPAFNLSQHQGLFQRGGQSIGSPASALVLPMNIQDLFPLGLISLLSKGLFSKVFSNTTVQKHQFFGVQPSLRSGTVSCGVTALFSWVLVHKVLLCPPTVYFPVLCKF